MQLALAQAEKAAEIGEVPVGAVVYRLDDLAPVAEAHNLRESWADPTAHAELVALRRAARQRGTWRLENCGIAVTLEPCPMCAGAIVNARIGQLLYGCQDPKMGCVESLHALTSETRFNHRLPHRSGIEQEACAEILKRFFRRKRAGNHSTKPAPQASNQIDLDQ